MRCRVYVRVSTDDQRNNGYSIDSQLRMIKEYCEKNHLLLVSDSCESLFKILMEDYIKNDEKLSEKNK